MQVGPAGVGKSQLCHMLAVSALLPSSQQHAPNKQAYALSSATVSLVHTTCSFGATTAQSRQSLCPFHTLPNRGKGPLLCSCSRCCSTHKMTKEMGFLYVHLSHLSVICLHFSHLSVICLHFSHLSVICLILSVSSHLSHMHCWAHFADGVGHVH